MFIRRLTELRFVLPCIVVLLATACTTTVPRYRKGGEEIKGDTDNSPKAQKVLEYKTSDFANLKTMDLIKLGRIIQTRLGTPYTGSSNFVKGLDCSEFTRVVFSEFNRIDLPRTAAEQFNKGHKIDRGHLRYGDLVFFRTNGKGISHVGIYIGYDEFVHASSSAGVIITGMQDEYWRKHYAGARRIMD